MATRALTKFDQVKAVMRSDEAVGRFAEVVGDHNARAYISSVLLAVANNDALQECSPQSIMTSAMRAATLKLTVDPALGQAHIVPFKGHATFVIGYKGLEQLALRTGKYRYINVATIYEGQTVVENQLKGIHSIQGLPTARVPIGYVLYFELKDGYAKTFYMTIEEITEHAQRYSKTFGNKSSPWTTNFPEMCKKTVMRLGLSRWGYFDPNDSLALSTTDDQEDETIDAEWMDKAIEEEENRPLRTEAEIMGDLYGAAAKDKPSPEPPVSAPAENTVPAEKPEASAEVKPRFTPTELRDKLYARAKKLTGKAAPEVKQAIAPTLEGILGGEDQRHEFIKWFTNGRFDTLGLLTDGELLALHEWLKPSYNRAAKVWVSTVPEAVAECTAAHREYLQANGAQGELL